MSTHPPDMVHVSAAILEYTSPKEETRICLARRSVGRAFAGCWELPGGKLHPGESAEAALRREILEELALDIGPATYFDRATYIGDGKTTIIDFFRTSVTKPVMVSSAHDQVAWLDCAELQHHLENPAEFPVIPPDVPILKAYAKFAATINSA